MQLGIRELKAKLSAFVERAARGEVITITSRGRAIAQLGPLPEHERLEYAVDEGWVTRAEDREPEACPGFAPRRGTHTSRTLDEDRGP